MKPLILILSLFLSLTAFGQQANYSADGFTNKAEAKNLMVNGLREGKWVEYLDSNKLVTTDKSKAQYYRLIVYNNGEIYGSVREYTKEGKLNWATYSMHWPKEPTPNNSVRPNLSVSALVDSIKEVDLKKIWCPGHRIDEAFLKSEIYLTLKVTNNSDSIVIYKWMTCPGIEGLYNINVDYMDIPDCLECAKNVEHHDSLLPHKSFFLKLMAVATKTPSELIAEMFRVSFVCDCDPNYYPPEWERDRKIYVYWSNALEIKK